MLRTYQKDHRMVHQPKYYPWTHPQTAGAKAARIQVAAIVAIEVAAARAAIAIVTATEIATATVTVNAVAAIPDQAETIAQAVTVPANPSRPRKRAYPTQG